MIAEREKLRQYLTMQYQNARIDMKRADEATFLIDVIEWLEDDGRQRVEMQDEIDRFRDMVRAGRVKPEGA